MSRDRRLTARRLRRAIARRRVTGIGRGGAGLRIGKEARSRTVSTERLWEIEDRYRARFTPEPLSYGTVRDLADSADYFGGLARASFDMKNMQRCWMVKAILGNVRPGGRLLEIGAGEPLVADLLSRLGHEVTVVDPYDGSGMGPHQYDAFRRAYPRIDFIRERFPPRAPLDDEFAAVYSISVLEHIPADAVGEVMNAAEAALASGGCSLHAIDHVLAGWGARNHLERLRRIVLHAGRTEDELHELIDRLESDPEAYFVSAEAHERWRGGLAYDDYPMRRIVSLNLFSTER